MVQPVIGAAITLGGNVTYTGASVFGGLLPNLTVAGGTGTLNYNGLTNIQSGTLQLSNSVTLSGITRAANGIGILTKSGPGILTLAGSGTYAGLTVVNGGTLQVNSLNTSTLTIGAGATLTIAALPGGPIGSLTPLYNVKPIPEPSVMVLLSIAVLAFIRFGLRPKSSTIRP